MPSVLRKEISTVWLIPLLLIGFPFLVAAVGRLLGAFGAVNFGEALVQVARVYGGLPIFLLGLSSLPIANTAPVYVFACIFYSGIIFLIVVGGGFVHRQARRSRRVV